MPETITCPHCSSPVGSADARCPKCGRELATGSAIPLDQAGAGAARGTGPLTALKGSGLLARLPGTGPLTEPSSQQITPEVLVPKLGEILVASGIVNARDLQRALEYQQKKSDMGHPRLLGRALIELGMIDRETLDQVITTQISELQAALQETNSQLESRVHERTRGLEWRLTLIHTAAEITRQASTATRLQDLLDLSVSLIVDRLNYYHASIYLVDEINQQATERASSSSPKRSKNKPDPTKAGSTDATINYVIRHREVHTVTPPPTAPVRSNRQSVVEKIAEAGIPILFTSRLTGILLVQVASVDAFAAGELEVLQIIANHLAALIQNLELLEQTHRNLEETSLLYQASQQISASRTPRDIFAAVASPLHRSSYVSAILVSDESSMRLLWVHDPAAMHTDAHEKPSPLPEVYPVTPADLQRALSGTEPLIIDTSDPVGGLPEMMYKGFRYLGCNQAAFIPIRSNEQAVALIILGNRGPGNLTQDALRVHASLAEMAANALEKVRALENMEKRLAALQTIDSVSHSISMETSLTDLFRVTHEQVTRVTGEVNFLIALYDAARDTIEIPYAFEENSIIQLPAIPLGQGLTSIIIRTRQPLLLVEDTEQKAVELGARVVGSPAKSWLGVPLLVGGEAIGAIVIQDLEQEHRFDQDDVLLLSNLAAQVAVSVRNARLIEETRRNAERERIISNITAQVWSSADMEAILRTAVQEIGATLKASRGVVRLELDSVEEA